MPAVPGIGDLEPCGHYWSEFLPFDLPDNLTKLKAHYYQ